MPGHTPWSAPLRSVRRLVSWLLQSPRALRPKLGADRLARGLVAGLSMADMRAIARGALPDRTPDPRRRMRVTSFLLHLRPASYRRGSTWLRHTWWLGWLSVYFLVLEVVTGLLLMLFYAPTPERAYGDMVRIITVVPFGSLVRDLHRLGAEGLVCVSVLHMARVFFTGAYKGPRRFTWLTGVVLLALCLGLSFTGYLLPWDQLAYWAVTIGTSVAAAVPLVGAQLNLLLRGAPEIWDEGLLRFYQLHVVGLPLLAALVLFVHYYKVARQHSISLPAVVHEGQLTPAERRRALEAVPLIPDILRQELARATAVTFVLVLAAAVVYDAPLGPPADPLTTPLHATAPWFFLWLQGLLKLGDARTMGVLLPTVAGVLLLVLPWLDQNPYRLARRRKLAVAMGIVGSGILVVLSYMGTPRFLIVTPPAQAILDRYLPADGAGPFRRLPWEELATGADGAAKTYFISYPIAWPARPEFRDRTRYEFIGPATAAEGDALHRLLGRLKAEIEAEPRLIPPQSGDVPLAVLTIEGWQPSVKWLELTISWDEVTSVGPQGPARLLRHNQAQANMAVHRDAAPSR